MILWINNPYRTNIFGTPYAVHDFTQSLHWPVRICHLNTPLDLPGVQTSFCKAVFRCAGKLLYSVLRSYMDFTLSVTHAHDETDLIRRIPLAISGGLALEENMDGSWDRVRDGRSINNTGNIRVT